VDRILAVVGFFVLAGGIAGVAIWWIRGNRELWERRDFRGLLRRRRQLWQATALVIAFILLAVAFFGSAYIYATGGVLAE